jgi:hypothetical protein
MMVITQTKLAKVCEAVYRCSLSTLARESWNSYVQQVRARAGSFRDVTSSEVQVSFEPPGVRATYVSSFEKTECKEIFDLMGFDLPLQDGRLIRGPLKIVSYRVLIDGKQIPPPQGKGDDVGKQGRHRRTRNPGDRHAIAVP